MSDSNSTFERFKTIAAEVLSVDPERITPEAAFGDDLEADSLDLVELMMTVEEAFDITVDESELEGVTTVQHVIDIIQRKLDEKS